MHTQRCHIEANTKKVNSIVKRVGRAKNILYVTPSRVEQSKRATTVNEGCAA
jgi:hypothetical protein